MEQMAVWVILVRQAKMYVRFLIISSLLPQFPTMTAQPVHAYVCTYMYMLQAIMKSPTYVQYPAIFVECVCAMSKELGSLGAGDIAPSLS